jgi:hypothetical protein
MHGSANPLLPRDLAERAISQSLITIRFVQTRPGVANLCWYNAAAGGVGAQEDRLMSEPAKVFFTGPTARRQALRYAMQKYGAFREVQLEPYARPERP